MRIDGNAGKVLSRVCGTHKGSVTVINKSQLTNQQINKKAVADSRTFF